MLLVIQHVLPVKVQLPIVKSVQADFISIKIRVQNNVNNVNPLVKLVIYNQLNAQPVFLQNTSIKINAKIPVHLYMNLMNIIFA